MNYSIITLKSDLQLVAEYGEILASNLKQVAEAKTPFMTRCYGHSIKPNQINLSISIETINTSKYVGI